MLPKEIYQSIKSATLAQVRGTVQADILKEDQAQNTCIFSTEFALRLMGDVQEYFIEKQETGWVILSSGSKKGLEEKSFVDITKNEPGIYEYLVLAMSTSSRQTIAATTTVTVS